MSNYAIKAGLINATGVDVSEFPKKVNLTNLKSDVDKLQIDKLENVPIHLNNLKIKIDKTRCW